MDTKSFHLEGQPAPEALLTGVGQKGEVHETTQSASAALLAGGSPTSENHLRRQHAPEGLLTGVGPKGEFHEIPQSASEAFLAGVAWTDEIHLRNQCAPEDLLTEVAREGEFHGGALKRAENPQTTPEGREPPSNPSGVNPTPTLSLPPPGCPKSPLFKVHSAFYATQAGVEAAEEALFGHPSPPTPPASKQHVPPESTYNKRMTLCCHPLSAH